MGCLNDRSRIATFFEKLAHFFRFVRKIKVITAQTSGYHRQPQKSGAKIHFSNRHPKSPRHQRTLFIQLIYSCFSRYQVPTNSVAPSSVYKAYTTHNSSICSDEGLTLETSAFQSLYGGQFTLSTPLINQIFVFHSPTDAAPQFL